MNESNNKFYFIRNDGNYNSRGFVQSARINKFLKRAILWKRPHRDTLEIIDVVHGDNNNNNNIDDINGEGREYPITLRVKLYDEVWD